MCVCVGGRRGTGDGDKGLSASLHHHHGAALHPGVASGAQWNLRVAGLNRGGRFVICDRSYLTPVIFRAF